MIKIGITGSLASGKTTASKIISKNKGPLFSADKAVKKLYSNKVLRKTIAKKLNLKSLRNLKKEVKNSIYNKKSSIKKLEKIIHPKVRKEMFRFFKKNKEKKYIFCEVPLLIENKLSKYFDVVIFIRSEKNLRLRRYVSKGGSPNLFYLLNTHQLKDKKKFKFCDHIVVNNKSLIILKRKLLNIMKKYE
tara:strand:+ start:1621 stop:2187 length:567 start_codon:yes stop_codon:yes gene_type:complete